MTKSDIPFPTEILYQKVLQRNGRGPDFVPRGKLRAQEAEIFDCPLLRTPARASLWILGRPH